MKIIISYENNFQFNFVCVCVFFLKKTFKEEEPKIKEQSMDNDFLKKSTKSKTLFI